MENNEDIKEAKEELDKISQDDILRRMALKAEIERMDHEQLMYEARRDGLAEGEKKGKIAGEKQGRLEGERKAKTETAKKMLEEKLEIELITKITGLSKEEIMKISK